MALTVMGVLFVLLEVQSPTLLLWTGKPVHGTAYARAITYTYQGQTYVIADPHPSLPFDQHAPVTVRLNPVEPGDAIRSRPQTRWAEGVLVWGWFVAAGGCLLAGALYETRSAHRRRQRERRGTTAGEGIDPEVIERLRRRENR
jgi:hypothetical protein